MADLKRACRDLCLSSKASFFLPLLHGALPQPSSLILFLRTLHGLCISYPISSGVHLPPLPFYLSPNLYCKVHWLAHPLVFVSYKRLRSRKPIVVILSPGQWLEGLLSDSWSSACELGASLSAGHRCEETAPDRTLRDCGPFSPLAP